MKFTENELKVIKYALEWMNNPDTFKSDHDEFPEIWGNSFGQLDLKTVLDTHKKLLGKFES